MFSHFMWHCFISVDSITFSFIFYFTFAMAKSPVTIVISDPCVNVQFIWCNKLFFSERTKKLNDIIFYLFAKMIKNIMWINYYNSHDCFEWNILWRQLYGFQRKTCTQTTEKKTIFSIFDYRFRKGMGED